jgi:hypothetical protein
VGLVIQIQAVGDQFLQFDIGGTFEGASAAGPRSFSGVAATIASAVAPAPFAAFAAAIAGRAASALTAGSTRPSTRPMFAAFTAASRTLLAGGTRRTILTRRPATLGLRRSGRWSSFRGCRRARRNLRARG